MVPTVTTTTVAVSDVRNLLRSIPEPMIKNIWITMDLANSEALVLSEIGDACTQATFDRAVLFQAAFMSLWFYANIRFKVAHGEDYPNIESTMRQFERWAVQYRMIASRSTKDTGIPAVKLKPDTESSSLMELGL